MALKKNLVSLKENDLASDLKCVCYAWKLDDEITKIAPDEQGVPSVWFIIKDDKEWEGEYTGKEGHDTIENFLKNYGTKA